MGKTGKHDGRVSGRGTRFFGGARFFRRGVSLSDRSIGFPVLWIVGTVIALGLMAAVVAELFAGGFGRSGSGQSQSGQEEQRFRTWEQQVVAKGSQSDHASTDDTSFTDPQAPAVSAQSAVVMDLTSGRILYEKKKDAKVYPASTTKIMTALLGIEYGQLDRNITVGGEAIGVEGSSIYLKAGETMSLEDLLYGAMLRSGNDAATAIAMAIGEEMEDSAGTATVKKTAAGTAAEPVSSSVERFVALMNQRAQQIGAVNTHFANPTGLHDENHYTTAYDMALIGRTAMLNPAFSVIAGAENWTAQRQEDRDPYFYNKNKVVHQYDGGTGVKIGYTKATGRTLVASSERDGRKLICVVMNAPDWFNDAYRLMDYAYETFESAEIAAKGQRLSQVAVEGGVRDSVWVGVRDSVTCLVRPAERDNIGVAYAVTEPVKAPLRRGDQAGLLHIYVSGQYVYSVPLYFFEDVDGGKK